MNGKMVFELGDWAIYMSDEKDNGVKAHVYCVHLGCRSDHLPKKNGVVEHSAEFSSWLATEPPWCWNCEIQIPEEIQALVVLHEWGHCFE